MEKVLVDKAALQKARQAYQDLRVSNAVCRCLLIVCLIVICILVFKLSETIELAIPQETMNTLTQIDEDFSKDFSTINLPINPR